MHSPASLLVFVLLLSISMHTQNTAQFSRVIPEQTAIRSQPSSASRQLGSATRDQRVLVDMVISASDGAWCLVRDPDRRETLGYVSCSALTREAMPKSSADTRVDAPPETPSAPPPSRVVPSRGAALALETWSSQLHLTEQQRRSVDALLISSGLLQCRDDLARTYRHYGVYDAMSMLNRMSKAAKDPFRDSFMVVVEPKLKRGAASYKSFWQGYWNLLTREQQRTAPSSLVLAYLFSQSEPDTGFNGFVLQYIRASQAAAREPS